MRRLGRSSSRGSTASRPITKTPQEALSATVSWMRIFQSWMRESTISKQGITHSVASSTSCSVTPGPSRSRLSLKAISPSARGWIRRLAERDISAPSSNHISRVMKPKSGWCTSSMRCTASEVTPIFLPTMASPAATRRSMACSEMR
ncbi:hypothetical protein D3C76_1388740 [compost metagenome]